MSKLKILIYPDKRLRKIAKPVNDINSNIQSIIYNMFEIMYSNDGIGLAATQINIHKQIIVIDIWKDPKKRLVFINPNLLNKTGETGIIEGCLSIPNQHKFITRSRTIRVRALNQYGYTFEIEACDLLAICIQHEIDHLIGKLFIDYLTDHQNLTQTT
ncbi:peptide deformylase [Blochmannia endosymbiont of Polyrhachis (Hedomyrma) turneri]|nr:peptide deformylase [Blochmannia endosymbiont of Polyrhachis (Hedomyrma) turneri]